MVDLVCTAGVAVCIGKLDRSDRLEDGGVLGREVVRQAGKFNFNFNLREISLVSFKKYDSHQMDGTSNIFILIIMSQIASVCQ